MNIPEYIKIPKPMLVCDACNDILINGYGKVLKDCEWNKWGLVCKKHKMKDFEVYERYIEGDKISKTHQLFKPMVMMFYGKNEEDF